MPSAPDPARHLTLVLGAVTTHTLGDDAPTLAQKRLQQCDITQVDRLDLGLAEPADFFPERAAIAPTVTSAPASVISPAFAGYALCHGSYL